MRHILLPPVARATIGGRRGQVTSCYQLRGELGPGPDWGWQQPKYLHTTIKNGFDFFLLMILQQNYLRVNPVRVWAQAWVESVLWYEDIIVLGLRLEQGTCDYNCHCYSVTGYHTALYDTTTYQVTLYTLLICWLWLRGCVRWTLNMLRLWSKQIKFLQHLSHMIWWWNSIIKDITAWPVQLWCNDGLSVCGELYLELC